MSVLTDPVNIALISSAGAALAAFIGAIGGWLAARVNKAPDAQAAVTAGFTALLGEYQKSLEDLKSEIADLKAEVFHLREVLEQHSIQVPPRKREVLA